MKYLMLIFFCIGLSIQAEDWKPYFVGVLDKEAVALSKKEMTAKKSDKKLDLEYYFASSSEVIATKNKNISEVRTNIQDVTIVIITFRGDQYTEGANFLKTYLDLLTKKPEYKCLKEPRRQKLNFGRQSCYTAIGYDEKYYKQAITYNKRDYRWAILIETPIKSYKKRKTRQIIAKFQKSFRWLK